MLGKELVKHLFGRFDGIAHIEIIAPRSKKLNGLSTQEYHTTNAHVR